LQQADFEAFHSAICALLDQLAIPVTLFELGVPLEAAGRLAEKAHQDAAAGTNPREADVGEIERLIIEAITVGR
jgi:alcohol dehydrogenase class IV